MGKAPRQSIIMQKTHTINKKIKLKMKIQEEKKQNAIALFGGSFDPVTNAHVAIVKNLTKQFGTTVVVPSFISPFKKGGSFASGSDRLAMLNLALKPNSENLLVSDYEIAQEGTSYTINTVRHLASKYPNRPIYLAIGSEGVKKLHKWHEFDTLKQLVTFYVIQRPYLELAEKAIERYAKKHEAAIEIAPFSGDDFSSSTARLDVAFTKFATIPASVAKHIQKQNLYKDFSFIVDKFAEFGLEPKRIEHIYRTATMALKRAKMHSASETDVALAALLHDIAKQADYGVLSKYGIDLNNIENFANIPEKLRHAFVGAELAKAAFGFKKRALLDAIAYHTSGAPKMGKLAKILFIADFSELGRDWEIDKETLNYVRGEKSLNKAVRAILNSKIKLVEAKGNEVYYLTRDALDFYTPKAKASASEELGIRSEELSNVAMDAPRRHSNGNQNELNKNNNSSLDKTHLAYTIATILDNRLGKDITLIHIDHKTTIADYFVIATANSTTAVRALTDHVDEELSKKHGLEPLRRDIDKSWAAIDYGSVIMHIQLPETREYYNLERLWSDGENVEKFN